MNIDRESVIKWAREAEYGDAMADLHASALERFAALVAAATAKEYEERLRFTQERWEIECKSQVEIEREELKKLDWTALLRDGGLVTWGDAAELGDRVIAAIRARGQE